MNVQEIAEKDREAMMNCIRDSLYGKDTLQLRQTARKIGRTYDCLIRIRSGRTRWPLADTLFSLIYVLDLRMVLLPAVIEAYDTATVHAVEEMRTWH